MISLASSRGAPKSSVVAVLSCFVVGAILNSLVYVSHTLRVLPKPWRVSLLILLLGSAIGCVLAQSFYNLHLAAVAEGQRLEANEAMATAFETVDYVAGLPTRLR